MLISIWLRFMKEFDPGSERMLAAGLTHASQANNHIQVVSGERVSNT